MRKWHRWLSVFFGIFILWIAVTGLLSQVVPWFEPPRERPAAAAPAAGTAPVASEARKAEPRRGRSIVGTLHHLHSGETFGPVGQFISALSGIALIFFAVSGMWMYVQMFRNRTKRSLKPRWFWK